MIGGKWMVPALVFFAGAVFGRIFGVKPLVRGVMTAAAIGRLEHGNEKRNRSPARKLAHRPARRRMAPRRSRAA